MASIEGEADVSLDPDAQAYWKDEYTQRGMKRQLDLAEEEFRKRKV